MTVWSENLEGSLFPAVPVPFKQDGTPDFAAQKEYAAWLASQEIDGVAVWVHTGRGRHLDPETRAVVIETWRDAIGSGRKIIAGAGPAMDADAESTLPSTLSMAEEAEDADLLLVFPPTAFREAENRDDLIIEYHREIARLGIPLLLFYLYPEAGGISYSEKVLDELLGMTEIAGIKMATLDSACEMQDVITHTLVHHRSKAVLTGEDRLYGYSFYRGCHGALMGLGGILPDLQRELIDSWFLRETRKYLQTSRLVDHLAEVIFIEPMEGYIGRLLFALSYQGLIPEDSAFDPWGPPISEIEKEFIKATIDRIEESRNE